MPVTPEAQASMDALKALRKDPMSDNEATVPAVLEGQGVPLPPPKVAKKITSYDVYTTSDAGTTLLLIASDVQAANDIKAIASLAPEADTIGYLAIPQRSLKVRTVSSVSVPKVNIS